MIKQLLCLFGSMFMLLVLLSTDQPEKNNLYYFNSLSDLKEIELNHGPGIYEGTLRLKIKAPKNARIELITNNTFRQVGNDVTISSPAVLCISYRNNEGEKRKFVGNYIVNQSHTLPIVALVVDTNDFFPPNGIYKGHIKKDTAGGDPLTIGRAWYKNPITAFAQFFFNNKLKDELELDLKTYGGMTLGWKEKSLQLSARKKLHGEGKSNVKAFRQIPFRKYQHLVLRTSGNDQNKTRLKDMSISMVADDIDVNTKASRSVVLYVNGVYWGIHNLREKVNGDYFKYRYSWKKGNFQEIQGSGFQDPSFRSLIYYVRAHHSDEDFYQRVSDSIDVENFFNFNIIQTYISNVDYRGNVRFFRHKDGKWKWVLYDVDLSCEHSFLNRNFIRDRTFPTTRRWYNPPYSTALLHHMLLNQNFKEQFVRQYNYLMASKLSTANFMEKIDSNISVIQPELERHLARRNLIYRETLSSWEGKIKTLKSYLKKRPASAVRHLRDVFKLAKPKHLKLTQNYSHFNGISMNHSRIQTNQVNGMFFTEFGIDVQINKPNHLYRFVKWSDGNNLIDRNIKLTEDSTHLKANFKHLQVSSKHNIKLKRYYVNNKKNAPLLFVTLINPTSEKQNMNGVTLYEDNSGSSISLNDYTLQPGEEMVLTNNCELFKENVKNKSVKVFNFMEGMTFVNEVMFALIDKEGWIDSLQFQISDSMLIENPGYLIVKKSSGITIIDLNIKKIKEMTFGMKINAKLKEGFSWSWIMGGLGILVLIAVAFVILRKRRITNTLPLLIFTFLITSASISQSSLPEIDSGQILNEVSIDTDTVRVKQDQFGLSSIEKRVIDNKGRGDERFYGTRNFRVVLYDLVYRGGGNNLHLKDTIPKYYLWNPMPSSGLRQLSEIGFDKAVYLYSYNFDYWYPETRLDSLRNENFEYICRPKLDRYLEDYLQDVMDRANDSVKRMMYIHCWNGWHQSGLLSAYTLMQFCDYSNQEALKYWERCTDGNYRGFAKVKSRISNYKPFKQFYFTEAQQKRYCPCEKDVSGTSSIQSEDDKINLSEDEMMEKGADGHSSQTKNYIYHTIATGESLSKIAEKYGMRLSALQSLNRIHGTTIYAGKKLKVINHKGVTKTISPKTSSSESTRTYTVKSGDTLYFIAEKFNSSIEAIKKVNRLKSNTIFPGQKIKIP